MENKKLHVIGAGLSGAVLAERIAHELKEPVVVIEKKNHIGTLRGAQKPRPVILSIYILCRFGQCVCAKERGRRGKN